MSVLSDVTVAPEPAAVTRNWWHSSRHVLGVLITALWLVVAALSLWAIPHQATGSELQEALTEGRVAGWTFVGRSPSSPAMGSSQWDLGLTRQQHAMSNASYVVWQTDNHRRYVTDLAALAAHRGDYNTLPEGVDSWLNSSFEQQHPDAVPTDADWANWVGYLALALGLVTLAGILSGDAPRIGTRWFWFWLTGFTFGLGFLAYAVLEGLRDGRPVGRWFAKGKRLTGLQGVVVLAVGSWVVSVGLGLLTGS